MSDRKWAKYDEGASLNDFEWWRMITGVNNDDGERQIIPQSNLGKLD